VQPTTTARLQLLTAAALFSTGGTAIKATELSGAQVAVLRSLVAGVVLALLVPAWRRSWDRRTLQVALAYGATMTLFAVANKLTTAANVIFLQSTAPLYLMALGPRLLGEPTRRADIGFAALLALGMALFFAGTPEPLETAPEPALGNAIALFTGVCWAATLAGLRWLGRERGPEATGRAVVAGNFAACAMALPFAFPAVLPAGPSAVTDWAVVAYLGAFQIGLAYVFVTRAVPRVRALEASLLLLLEPVLSSVWAWWVHGERSDDWALAGCAIILLTICARTVLLRGQD